jgi:hypothetical protein
VSFTTEDSKLILLGDGVETVFPYNFLIYADTHLAVYLDGVLQSTGYTVDGVGDALGGDVTFDTAPAADVVVTLNLEVPFTQELSYTQGGKFPSASHEKGLDLNTMLCRRLNEVDSRALLVPQGGDSTEDLELPSQTDRASKYLAFDADGNPVATAGTENAFVVSTFMETVLDDSNGSEVAETLIDSATAETAPASGDLVLLSDVSANAGRKMTLSNLLKVINELTEDTTPDKAADFVVTYDTSASGVKKAKPDNLIPAASETVSGRVELATQAEVNAMTDTARALTPNHNKIIEGGSIATTSGTTRDITGVPSGVRRITGHLIGVSLSGTNDVLLQVRDAGGLENSGYNGVQWQGSTGVAVTNLSSAFILMSAPGAAGALYGKFTLDLADSATNTWTLSSSFGTSGAVSFCQGSKALSATLDGFSLLVSGANTFDAGTLYYTWER